MTTLQQRILSSRLAELRNRFDAANISPLVDKLCLLALILMYFFVTAVMSRRYLWHDELYTYYIAEAPSLAAVWQDIHLDLHPPLMFFIARLSLSVFGDSAYALRLPFILVFLAGSLCLYLFIARRLRPIYGALAVLVFWSTPIIYYATEARPYGLILGFFAMVMLAWQNAVKPGRSGKSLLLLLLSNTAMMLTHFFGVFFLFPFGLGELVRWRRNRKPDLALWAVLAIPAALPLIYYRVMASYSESLFPADFQAGFHKMAGFYYYSLSPEGWVLLLAFCGALAVAYQSNRAAVPSQLKMTTLEQTFLAGLLLLPVVVNLALMGAHGAFFPRYAAPAVLGYSIALAFLLAAYTNLSRSAAAAACGLLLLYIPADNVLGPLVKEIRRNRNSATISNSVSIDRIKPNLPLVAASGLTFLEMDHYESPGTAGRLFYLTDRTLAIRYAHATLFESLPNLKRHFPIRASVEPYRQFIREHGHFLVIGTPDYPEDWLIRYLVDTHAKLEYLGDFPGPYKDSQLFEITLPAEK
jgi:hypothetical protein